MAGKDHDKVRERAYHLWQERGAEHGQDMDHWLEAEREFAGAGDKSKTKTAKVKAKPAVSDAPAATKKGPKTKASVEEDAPKRAKTRKASA